MSFIVRPAAFRATGVEREGPRPIRSGSRPANPHDTIRPIGRAPFPFTNVSEATTTAAPPSVIWDELPAVTEPNFRSKNGFSFARASIVWFSRMPLSAVATLSNAGGSGTGTISSATLALAAAAFWCEPRANRSCISRAIFPSFARSSAVSPMFRPQTGSESPSLSPITGFSNWAHGSFEKALTRPLALFAIAASVSAAFTGSR